MGRVREDFRITSKELYVYCIRHGEMFIGGCSNKRILSERTGVGYDNLVRIFTREKRVFFDNGEVIILRLSTGNIKKGNQSLSLKGKGGSSAFNKYIRYGEN
jgi:hypothetical protein